MLLTQPPLPPASKADGWLSRHEEWLLFKQVRQPLRDRHS